MSTSTNAAAGSGIGLGGLVFVVLLVLKLTKLAVLSWFWVFFPLWAPLGAFIGISLAVAAVAGLVWLGASFFELIGSARRERRFNKRLK